MSYGYWLEQAHVHLTHAAAALISPPQPTDPGDALAALAARRRAYRALIRHVELLVNGQPGPSPLRQAAATSIMQRRGQQLTRLYVGLHTASRTPIHRNAIPATAVAHHLRAAADAAEVAADLLAGHVPLGRSPRSPEGVAIRDGAGVQHAIAMVAQLTRDLVRVDSVLPPWALIGDASRSVILGRPLGGARWADQHGLAAVADDLVAAGTESAPLLWALHPVPLMSEPLSTVADIRQAVEALHSVNAWLYQSPDRIAAVHLRLGTLIGLAATPDHHRVRWRSAVDGTAGLRGPPPMDTDARDTAHTMKAVHTWVKEIEHQRATTRHPLATRMLALLGHHLPHLADALRNGIGHQIQRGDLYTNHSTRLTRRRGMILYAESNWQRATSGREPIASLTDVLGALAPYDFAQALKHLVHRGTQVNQAFVPLRIEASDLPSIQPPPSQAATRGRRR